MAGCWWQQAITWTNVDFSLMMLCDIDLRLFYILFRLKQNHTLQITATSPRGQWVNSALLGLPGMRLPWRWPSCVTVSPAPWPWSTGAAVSTHLRATRPTSCTPPVRALWISSASWWTDSRPIWTKTGSKTAGCQPHSSQDRLFMSGCAMKRHSLELWNTSAGLKYTRISDETPV